jgi:TPP-dependent pyruvate/acetoin dehydrogenase alpha subunit
MTLYEPVTQQLDLDAPISVEGVGGGRALQLYGTMVLIREFEQRVSRLFLQGLIPGTIHLSLGQEACAAGTAAALQRDDWITITHRGHGQALAKGVSARSMMAELFARDTGCCRGRGGSLHVGDPDVGALPGIGIVGAAVPIAAGLALAGLRDGTGRVVASFLGDGAFTEGDTHEGLNLAALWRLPVVYVCENNLYSISTPLSRQVRLQNLAESASRYGMHTATVDGNNVCAVFEVVSEAVERARIEREPTFVECLTYRQGGHKRDDPATYRPQAEVDLWLGRDPIVRLRRSLEALNLSDDASSLEAAAVEAIDDAVAFAEESPLAVL